MATFSVSETLRRAQHTGNGSAGPFAFSFQANATSDLRVLVDATEKTLTTHFTVSLSSDGTGSVSFTSGNYPTSAQKITLLAKTPLGRTSVYNTGGSLTAAALESDHDTQVMLLQQLQEQVKRSVQLAPETQRVLTGADGTTTGPLQFPYSNTVADNASKVVAYDTNGTALTASQELGEFQGNWAASTAYVLRDIVKDTDNNNIYICITAHTSSGSVPLSSNADSAKWSLIVNAAAATTSAQLADDWAVKTSGVVESSEYSAKAYAVGGTGVSTSSGKGAAKEWATTTGGAVDTSEYSSKEYAIGTTVGVGSAKDWAVLAEDSAVTGSSYSALHHAAKGAASATAAAASATLAEASAGAVAFKYTFDSSTSVADPGSNGEWRWNNGTVGSVSSMALRAATADTGNPDISPYIITWDDSTSTVNGHLLFRKSGTPATFAIFAIGAIVDNTAWLQIGLTHVASNGTWSNADTGYISFIGRNGDKGDTGAQGPAGEMESFIMSDGSTTQTIADGNTQTFAAGSGLSATVSSTDTITYAGTDASTSAKGVASFHSDNFAVSSGAVTIKDGGVIEAEIADNAVTLAKMAGGTDGNIISFDASGDPVAIATGNDGQILTSAGAGAQPAFEDAAGGGGAWVKIATVDASDDASLDITGLDSTYDTYEMRFAALIPATDGADAWIRFGDSSGFDSASGDYHFSHHRFEDDGSANYSNSTSATEIRIGLEIGSTAGEGFQGGVTLHRPGDASSYPTISIATSYLAFGNQQLAGFIGIASRDAVITLDRVQFLFSSGNVASGRFTIWGISHA
jgi:hypothetical protein